MEFELVQRLDQPPLGVGELDLVVVVTAGNYNQPENWRLPVAVLNQFVLPALVGAPA